MAYFTANGSPLHVTHSRNTSVPGPSGSFLALKDVYHIPNLYLNLIYVGLKQAPHAWFERFRAVILVTGFTQNKHDYSMFIRTTKHEIYIILLYVDDILISGNDFNSIKDKYALDLVFGARLNDVKVVDMPMELNVKLFTHVGDPLLEPTMYRKLVGSLIYHTMTHLDIAYVVHVVSQFVSDPRQPHLSAVHQFLRYVRYTSIRGLFFDSTSSLDFCAYADADWADNQSAIKIASNPVSHERTKHINLKGG
ncbi:uncharacterized protein LOC110007614 [Amborella trichopoda]|uniref:uncharacterized protein LOC110007614 n=1 Tax=Amborella trichopoda TaxID=13333 RepID=UPI0009BEA2EC|nr:uncharacterized protein LOC110007614 [Amborella trichopoda]|eukprot:XP_020525383.1 uncharacterized protein LOC110007614 [Amborella trichopoda]